MILPLLILAYTASGLGFRLNSSDYLVGGQPASSNQFPYVVIIKHQNRFHCGGSLISQSRVLTAGHCALGLSPESLTATVGASSLYSGGVTYQVASVHPHPQFNPSAAFENDIAVLKLSQEVYGARTIGLPQFSSTPPARSLLTIAAFGIYQAGNPQLHSPSPNLRTVQLTVLDDESCRQSWRQNDVNILPSQFCTRTQAYAVGVCSGDSGSAYVYNGQAVGVVSFGSNECATGTPDVATRVSYYINFINQHLYS